MDTPASPQKHSERRRRQLVLRCRVTAEESELIHGYAEHRGISVSTLLRSAALGVPAEARRKRLPTTDQTLIAKVIGQLGKVGSNLNQIARIANSSGEIDDKLLYTSLGSLGMTLAALRRMQT